MPVRSSSSSALVLRVTVCALLAVHGAGGLSPAGAEPLKHGLADYTVTTWNERDGLSAGSITALAQDREGYLWIGTDVGLVRFDGVRFQAVKELGEQRLPFESVTALQSARDGSLWIGVGRSGIVRMRGSTFTTYAREDGFDTSANAILEDRAGTIWAGTSRGLYRFDGGRWHAESAASGLDESPVLAMHEDRAGRFWVATLEAVMRRERAGGRFGRIGVMGLSSNIWQSFGEDASGVVWVSDFRGAFRRADVSAKESATPGGWGVRLMPDRRGQLWVATRGQGLWRVGRTHAGDLVTDVITSREGLANDAVQSVFEDREGNIWVGTGGGLQRLTPHRVTPLTDIALPRATVVTTDGSLWVASPAGLFSVAPGERRRYQEPQGLPGIVVLALAPDPGGGLWVATERALARFARDRFTTVLTVPRDRRIFSIAVSDGAVWLRDVNFRLTRISERGETLPLDVPEAFQTNVFTLATDHEGRLWIGTNGGAVGVRQPGGGFHSLDPGIGSISTITHDRSGALWVGGGQGLARLAGERFVTLTGRNGLTSSVSAIVQDDRGVLWLGLRSGIARVEPEEIDKAAADADHQVHYRLFNSADGAAGIPVTTGSPTVVRGDDGRFWFATSGGVTVVDPAHVGDAPLAVPVTVEAVVADTVGFAPVPSLRLPARTSHVQFAFTALTLTDPLRVRFQYRLVGQDRDWVEAGGSRQASYTNLAPGPYQFLLRGSNGDASWSEPGAAIDFSIQPMFYQTRWFYALSVVAFSSMLYGAWRLHARRVRGQFALVLAERIRMSRAIHDTLLQGLAGLALQLDDLSHGIHAPSPTLKERVLAMRRRVEEYIRDARQSIWDLRSPANESRPLPDALRDVGLRTINGAPIAFEFATAGTPQPCSPAVQEQLLRICQEALTNAVRHGQPDRVQVHLEYTSEAVRVRVQDNGRGFDPSIVDEAGGHYGVISMRERAAQVRGRVTIASAPGAGTRVETVVPPM